MNATATIIYPDWNTKACVVHNREMDNDWNTVNEYALFSYETCICVYKEHASGWCELIFNTDGYQRSATTSKHFRWFVNECLGYSMENFVKSLMKDCKSTAEFLGVHARLYISAEKGCYKEYA